MAVYQKRFAAALVLAAIIIISLTPVIEAGHFAEFDISGSFGLFEDGNLRYVSSVLFYAEPSRTVFQALFRSVFCNKFVRRMEEYSDKSYSACGGLRYFAVVTATVLAVSAPSIEITNWKQQNDGKK